VDRSQLPLSLLIALGLAPEGCTTKSCHSPPADEGKPPKDDGKDSSMTPCLSPPRDETKDDPPIGPCLKVAPPEEVGPCLEVMPPTKEDPKEDPPVGPCLKVMNPDPPLTPCLSIKPNKERKPSPKDSPKDSGGMASSSRDEVIERVRAALPPDVAARLHKRDA
jgi:hypothetical protein